MSSTQTIDHLVDRIVELEVQRAKDKEAHRRRIDAEADEAERLRALLRKHHEVVDPTMLPANCGTCDDPMTYQGVTVRPQPQPTMVGTFRDPDA
jgi:hypothetical protein